MSGAVGTLRMAFCEHINDAMVSCRGHHFASKPDFAVARPIAKRCACANHRWRAAFDAVYLVRLNITISGSGLPKRSLPCCRTVDRLVALQGFQRTD